MSWLFGGKKKDDDDDEYESFTDEEYEEYEEYEEEVTDDEEEEEEHEDEEVEVEKADEKENKINNSNVDFNKSVSTTSSSNGGYPVPLEKTEKANGGDDVAAAAAAAVTTPTIETASSSQVVVEQQQEQEEEKKDNNERLSPFVMVERTAETTTTEKETEVEQEQQIKEDNNKESPPVVEESPKNDNHNNTASTDEEQMNETNAPDVMETGTGGEETEEEEDSSVNNNNQNDGDGDEQVVEEQEEAEEEDDDAELRAMEEEEEAELRALEEEELIEEEMRDEVIEEAEEEELVSSSSADDDAQQQTSLEEKHSLLALAAENDRVDILKAILEEANDEEKQLLLNSAIPPLHIAVSFGSVHASSSLLREGCDPSIRPSISGIKQDMSNKNNNTRNLSNIQKYDGCSAWELVFGGNGLSSLIIDGIVVVNAVVEAPEAGITGEEQEQQAPKSSSSWFGWSSKEGTTPPAAAAAEAAENGDTISSTQPATPTPKKTIKPLDMSPSKRESIRHSFTSEALRCIGSDEVDRLKQLLDSGMPTSIEVGNKVLYDWSIDLNAPSCTKLLTKPVPPNQEQQVEEEGDEAKETEGTATPTTTSTSNSVRDKIKYYENDESIPSLINKLEEQDSLAYALSGALDNLAEEVSVCHGLLLLGGGASALATHVRSLKDLRTRRYEELNEEIFKEEEVQDEVAYWMNEYNNKYNSGGNNNNAVASSSEFFRLAQQQQYNQIKEYTNEQTKEKIQRKYSFNVNTIQNKSEHEQTKVKNQLSAQLAATENKVRKLRASITDLSEENTNNLEEVDKRGLSGGIKLVRTLREEIRSLEYKLNETKSMYATCKTQVNLLQTRCNNNNNTNGTNQQQEQQQQSRSISSSSTETTQVSRSLPIHEEDDNNNNRGGGAEESEEVEESSSTVNNNSDNNNNKSREINEGEVYQQPSSSTTTAATTTSNGENNIASSERIEAGDSTAVVKRTPHDDSNSLLPLDLWEIILRIIGLGREAAKKSADDLRDNAASTIMIV